MRVQGPAILALQFDELRIQFGGSSEEQQGRAGAWHRGGHSPTTPRNAPAPAPVCRVACTPSQAAALCAKSIRGTTMPLPPCHLPVLLQGGAAVASLAPLAPYFGSGVTVQGGSLCAAGLSLSYAPLQASATRRVAPMHAPRTSLLASKRRSDAWRCLLLHRVPRPVTPHPSGLWAGLPSPHLPTTHPPNPTRARLPPTLPLPAAGLQHSRPCGGPPGWSGPADGHRRRPGGESHARVVLLLLGWGRAGGGGALAASPCILLLCSCLGAVGPCLCEAGCSCGCQRVDVCLCDGSVG